MADTASAAGGKKKGGKSIVIIAVLAVVVLGGLGGGAFWYLRKPAGAAAEQKEAAKPAHHSPSAGGVVSFEPFIVNLADANGAHFLRINVRLIVGEAEEAEKIQKNEVLVVRLRSEILELLTQQTSDRLVTADGKTELKKAISEHASGILEPAKISDVLFSDFVVQL